MSSIITFVKSEESFSTIELQADSEAVTINDHNISELSQTEHQVVLFAEGLEKSEIVQELENEIKIVPVVCANDLNLSFEDISNISYPQATDLISKIYGPWTLQNNIILTRNIFQITDHLRSMWPNDRFSFFESLWSVVKGNLGATNLKIVYNDMQKSENENIKDKLVQSTFEGIKNQSFHTSRDIDKELIESFSNSFSKECNLIENDPETGRVVLTATIQDGPILMMANIYEFSSLQMAIFKALFDGLQI